MQHIKSCKKYKNVKENFLTRSSKLCPDDASLCRIASLVATPFLKNKKKLNFDFFHFLLINCWIFSSLLSLAPSPASASLALQMIQLSWTTDMEHSNIKAIIHWAYIKVSTPANLVSQFPSPTHPNPTRWIVISVMRKQRFLTVSKTAWRKDCLPL